MTEDDLPSAKEISSDRHHRRRRIGQRLRQMYDDVANEPVPDEFLRLLEEADEETGEETHGSDATEGER
ncbi:MAG: NepR family anti-sigma factor [Pseudomonadota bacterium]